MNLFDKLVNEALSQQPSLSVLKVVVEKELLHHDILRIMSQNGFLNELTFIGGTCLRLCYGGVRLSEDLDFTGGKSFTRDHLSMLGKTIAKNLYEKYSLKVLVEDPVKEKTNVNTWKIKIETRPQQKNIPNQRINIDICSVPSYEKQPMMILNRYEFDMGTHGLIIQAQTREEIYTDKLLAFALRPNRVKYRDLWDIAWLHQKGIKPNIELIPNKLKDRNLISKRFLEDFNKRCLLIAEDSDTAIEFKKEMQRFLPVEQLNSISKQNDLWKFIGYLMTNFYSELSQFFCD